MNTNINKRKRDTISIERLHINLYFRIVRILLRSNAFILGPIFDDFILPQFHKLNDIFDPAIHDENETQLTNITDKSIYICGNVINLLTELSTMWSDVKYNVIKHNNHAYTKITINESIGYTEILSVEIMCMSVVKDSLFSIRELLHPMDKIVNTDGYYYSHQGLATLYEYKPSDVKDILNKTCTLACTVSNGDDKANIAMRAHILQRVFDKLKDGWTVTSTKFTINDDTIPEDESGCAICQEDIDTANNESYYRMKCKGKHVYHLECFEKQIRLAFETHTFTKCAQCKEEITL